MSAPKSDNHLDVDDVPVHHDNSTSDGAICDEIATSEGVHDDQHSHSFEDSQHDEGRTSGEQTDPTPSPEVDVNPTTGSSNPSQTSVKIDFYVPPSPRATFPSSPSNDEEEDPSAEAPQEDVAIVDDQPAPLDHEVMDGHQPTNPSNTPYTPQDTDASVYHTPNGTSTTPGAIVRALSVSSGTSPHQHDLKDGGDAQTTNVGVQSHPPALSTGGDIELTDLQSPKIASPPTTAAATANPNDGKPSGTTDLVKAALYNSKEDNNLTIVFKNVSHSVQVPLQTGEINTFISPITNLAKGIASCGASWKTREFFRCRNISGVVKPATMTLVLSPPGHGKSTYLRTLAHRIEAQTGHVVYNGRTFEEAANEGIDISKMIQYVDQVDTHLPLLTVTETLEFAHKLSSINFNRNRVDAVINMLGLEECKDTIIGDALIRGVSGGQRKRVSTGEMLVSDACTLFLDEFSNGLDTATSEDIARALRQWCTETNGSIVATLQQPTPGLFELFDRVVVLREGCIVYDGPQPDMLPYFEAMGFKCPDDVDVCDFIVDCLSQPRLAVMRQRELELHQEQRRNAKKTTVSSPKPQARDSKVITTSYGPLTSAPTPCITTEEMCEFYHTTPHWSEIKSIIDEAIPTKPLSNGNNTLHIEDDGEGSGDKGALHRINEERVPVPVEQLQPLAPTPSAQKKFRSGTRLSPFQTLTYLLARQVKVVTRNTGLIIPRMANAVLMSLIYGSIYWQIADDAFFLRVASLLICLAQVGYGNMVELPVAVSGNRVTYKQLASNFYPSWAHIITSMVMSLPTALIETCIFSGMLYWMCGAAPFAMEFFVFFFTILAQSINLSAWFRFLSVISNDEAQAQSIAGPSTGVFMVFGGFFVTEPVIPRFMIWLFWLSPFCWSTRALANNEFLSARYDDLISVDGSLQRKGDVYVRQLDMYLGEEWIVYSVIFLIASSICFLALQALLMHRKWYEESIGTRRNEEDEMVENEMDTDTDTAPTQPQPHGLNNGDGDGTTHQQPQASAGIASQEGQGDFPSQSQSQSIASQSSYASSVGSSTQFNLSALQTLREKLPFSPTWLSFNNIRYTVKVKKGKEMVDRVLLDGVYGYAEPGKLTALMGASGAGKTTLLDVLAGRKNMGIMEGNILLNGQRATPQQFAVIAGYVEQFDTLFAFNTVRETLLFASHLRLPGSVDSTTKDKIVDEVLDILDLTPIQNFLIGNPQIPGLSPSQLKRVNIGVELVANPSILFLDEPTTGLDSKSAQTVMRVVRRIARSGRSVICTIHQPSAELFFLFDRLVLLGSGGHQIYFGDLGRRSKTFIQYFSAIPGVKPITPRYNPASWMLEELGVGVATMKDPVSDDVEAIAHNDEWADLTPQQRTVQRFKQVYFTSDVFQLIQKRLEILENIPLVANDDELAQAQGKRNAMVEADPDLAPVVAGLPSHGTPLPLGNTQTIVKQLTLLFSRNFMGYYRNPPFIFTRLVSVTVLSILFGLIYLGLEPSSQAGTVSSIAGCAMAALFGCLIHGASSLPVFMANREVFYRERSSGFYNPTLWPMVNLGIELVWCSLGAVLIQLPAYWLIGLKEDAGVYFTYLLAVYLNCLTYVAVSMLVSSVAPSTPVANILNGSYFSVVNIFTGIAIPIHSIPRGWLWVFRAFPSSHVSEALVMPQFEGNMTEIDIFLEGENRKSTVHDYVMEYLGYEYGHYWKHLGWMLLFFVVVQIGAYIANYYLIYNKR